MIKTLSDETIICMINRLNAAGKLKPIVTRSYRETGTLPKADYFYYDVFGEFVRIERDYSGNSIDADYTSFDENLRVLMDEDDVFEDIVSLNAMYKGMQNKTESFTCAKCRKEYTTDGSTTGDCDFCCAF